MFFSRAVAWCGRRITLDSRGLVEAGGITESGMRCPFYVEDAWSLLGVLVSHSLPLCFVGFFPVFPAPAYTGFAQKC